jgi:hypothetical protein
MTACLRHAYSTGGTSLLVAAVWGIFNAGYVVYLTFARRALMTSGYCATQAA